MKYSNQRITKIKKDYIEELLKRAESMSVEDACSIQEAGSDLTPYPDLSSLRLWSREYLLKGINKIYPVSFTDEGQTYLTTIVDGLVLFTKLTKSIDVGEEQFETSKPGLWLSNLVQPVTDSLAGSWLRHNLIHNSLSFYTSLNADTIGNYTFSFFQRGIIHRDKGSTHNDNDSYCQHWSPSALGCISHDAIIIPTNNLRSTYTSYQMPVTPVNPDMQSYEETMSKDVAFTFVDNTNNIPLNTTMFNGRVVGDGWIYELLFTPNGNGSGNDYGNGDNPSADNGSNGGCVTGTITYQDSDLGTTCTQEVNYCFQTNQSYFNPNAPQVSDNAPEISDIESYKVTGTLNACCYDIRFASGPNNGRLVDGFWVPNLKVTDVNNAQFEYWTGYVKDGGSVQFSSSVNELIGFTWSTGATCGSSTKKPLPTYNASGYCGLLKATISGTIYNKKVEPEEGINLYLNIYDLKKQYESEGIPWTGGCGTARFDIEISTTKCDESYCKSILIAENVDINSLGDISKLEEQVWANSN